ncbi:RNI-like protein [Guyanagaster necrorhizus]|uniref:RNI-like protein n=1 Tax=Guyanagaster necrorhizus TaxID=856835 RepID=A0A9P7VH10_9AGAR|nr:RNI-like protein [Guyanagaster necrorhizus MCA 3950]KAG7440205.1 RNI-like protein [Guyanagaster necrorhizus MCA 3950]
MTSSPSSSAVTIPIPGKSILKRPPPAPPSLFSLSRLSRLLPDSTKDNVSEKTVLKRAHFILPELSIVYPISSFSPPSGPGVREEKKAVEERERERRKRVIRGEGWTMDKVESFWRECCAGCDEDPDPLISIAFKKANGSHPRIVDFSGVQLTTAKATVLGDVFTIEWGLRRLVFKECDLDENILKPMLHALLIPNTLTFLSVASNRRLKTTAFRLIAAFAAKSASLEFLDLSQNALDKKSVELLVAALTALVTLRLDDCSLRPGALETLSRAVRTSNLRNISLRYNRINPTGAVSLALMIRDYPDVVPATTPSATSSIPSTPTNSGSPTTQTIPLKNGSLPPPPKHPTTNVQTTYTPYVPRAKRAQTPSAVPMITSSSQGGVTTNNVKEEWGPSAALLVKVRALDTLPRIGALRTLDLKGNELRGGITYIAQVLKRNRTLKVLNLSENKLDVAGLVAVAEALKYNSSLETLDLSKNPCAGPALDGITSLRTAFTLNASLKRLFLSSTGLTSPGAIALAEFLPESRSLLHLDLTRNELDLAGVWALNKGLKSNHTMRCLDLDVPPGREEFAGCCREILGWCVRNTEEADARRGEVADRENGAAEGVNGRNKGLWGLIEDSELARGIREGEERKIETDVVVRARSCVAQLQNLLNPAEPSPLSTPHLTSPSLSATFLLPSYLLSPSTASFTLSSRQSSTKPSASEIAARARALISELSQVIEEEGDEGRMEELLGIHDQLTSLLAKVPSKPIGLGLVIPTTNGVGSVAVDTSPDGDPPTEEHTDEEEVEEEIGTPRVDKGKGRAEPVHEKVLSPTAAFLIAEDDGEDGEGPRFPPVEVRDEEDSEGEKGKGTNRSRIWVEEEGEVFRKGTVLLGPEEMEGEYAGEELRKELLEAMVERPPPRSVEELSLEIPHPSSNSHSNPGTPTEEQPTSPTTAAPRSYIPRRTSSGSLMSLVSPTSPRLANPVMVVGMGAAKNGLTTPTISELEGGQLGPSISRRDR